MALPSKQSEQQSIPGGVTTLTHLGSPRVLRAKEKPSNDGKLSKKQVRCDGIGMRQSKAKWDVLAQSLEIEDPGQAQYVYMDNMIEALQKLRAKETQKSCKKQVRCDGIVMRQSKTEWDVLAESLEIEDPGQAQHEYMDNMMEALQEGEWAHWRAQFQDCCTCCIASTRSN